MSNNVLEDLYQVVLDRKAQYASSGESADEIKKNCAELLAKEDIDGGLIGGASLVAEKFGVLLAEASK